MSLAFTEAGSGPAMVLLHAFPCSRAMWAEQVDPIAGHGWHVIAPDLPGFGDSAPSPEPPDIGVAARAVLATLDERGIDRFVLGGLSMGGYVAMAILGEQPERVAGLALVDTKMTLDTDAARRNRLAVADRALAAPDNRWLVAEMIPALLGETTRRTQESVVETVSQWIMEAAPQSVAWGQRAMAGRPDSTERLRRFTKPCVIIAGEEDTLSPPAGQREMAAVIPDSELVLIPAVGHLTAVEAPERVTGALLEFAASLKPPFEGG